MKRISIVVPVYNDWDCFQELCNRLDCVAQQNDYEFQIVAVNDGSSERMPTDLCAVDSLPHLTSIDIIELQCNLGHQRAIAIGLTEVARRDEVSKAIVMDADGEDSPDDIIGLIKLHERYPDAIVLAQRIKRSEGLLFVTFYWIYKQLFFVLTGRVISFGNFSLIPPRFIHTLIHTPSLWSSLSATILRSRVPLVLYPTKRARRFFGESKMNFTSLVLHGLQAISVFGETVLIRLSIISVIGVLVALAALSIVIGLRVFTDLLVPGYTSNIIGIFCIVILQLGTMVGGAGLLVLHSRSMMPIIPAIHTMSFIHQITRLRPIYGEKTMSSLVADEADAMVVVP